MLTGMSPGGAIGGTVNVVPKRAGSEPLNQVTAGYAYSGQFGAHVDVGRRLGDDQQFGARFNGVFRAGNTAIERNTEQVGLASLGLDFRGDNVRLFARSRLPVRRSSAASSRMCSLRPAWRCRPRRRTAPISPSPPAAFSARRMPCGSACRCSSAMSS